APPRESTPNPPPPHPFTFPKKHKRATSKGLPASSSAFARRKNASPANIFVMAFVANPRSNAPPYRSSPAPR
ncbi:hypothetical protein GWI33_011373, partial [Rhynchophorus ferrugineus]